MKKSKWWLKLLIALAVIAAGGFAVVNFVLPKPIVSLGMSYNGVNVSKSDFEISIQGTGNIKSAHSQDIIAHRGGEVRNLMLEAGDAIDKDTLLAEVYDETLQNEIDRQQADITQQGINMSKVQDTLKNFKIEAPASGRIKKLEAREGQEASSIVQAHGALCVISPDGKMKVTVQFNSATRSGTVARNQKIYVRIDGLSYEGTLTDLNTGSMTVELDSDNFDIGAKAEVYQDSVLFDLFGEGKLEVVNAIPVTGSGRITKTHIREGQIVSRGDVLFSLDDTDVRKSLSASGVAREYSKDTLEKNREKLEDNKIYNLLTGVIQSLNIKNGQLIQQGMLVATVVDNKNLEVVIEVDELDIPKIKLGQKATIRVDAMPDEKFEGKVSKISELGKIVNTVTTYDVTISLQADRGIKIGMTASAEILADQRSDVMSVPREALIVQNGENYVRVLPGGEAALNITVDTSKPGAELPAFELRKVAIGMKSESYVEITEGLNEGDFVLTEKEAASNAMAAMFSGGPRNGGGGGSGSNGSTPSSNGGTPGDGGGG